MAIVCLVVVVSGPWIQSFSVGRRLPGALFVGSGLWRFIIRRYTGMQISARIALVFVVSGY